MILTDEIIEKGAKAMHQRKQGSYAYGDPLGHHRLNARACLEAVLPEILERPRTLHAAHIAGLKDALDAVTALAKQNSEKGYYGKMAILETGADAIRSRIKELEGQ